MGREKGSPGTHAGRDRFLGPDPQLDFVWASTRNRPGILRRGQAFSEILRLIHRRTCLEESRACRWKSLISSAAIESR
jgi:hypothetical protein